MAGFPPRRSPGRQTRHEQWRKAPHKPTVEQDQHGHVSILTRPTDEAQTHTSCHSDERISMAVAGPGKPPGPQTRHPRVCRHTGRPQSRNSGTCTGHTASPP